MRLKTVLAAYVAAAASLTLDTAQAHHSFAVFNPDASITVRGTVADFMWVNPHCWLDLTVTNADGSTEKWGFEGGPPLMMRNQGISKDTFKVGDEVVVVSHPRKDGTHAGSIVSITAASGQAIIAPRRPVSGALPPAAPAPTAPPAGGQP